jgi:hypothetical protein
MSNDNEPTTVEKTSGNLVTNITSNLFAIYFGGISALLPALFGTLAFERFQKRIGESLQDISDDLETQKEKLDNLTDAQFKLINEVSCTVLSTIHEEKLAYLRKAIKNTLDDDKILDHESVLISRIIRDISVDEIKFLIKYEEIRKFSINPPDLRLPKNDTNSSVPNGTSLSIPCKNGDVLLVSGLSNLGVLFFWTEEGGVNGYSYTPIAEKLRNLLREKPDK